MRIKLRSFKALFRNHQFNSAVQALTGAQAAAYLEEFFE